MRHTWIFVVLLACGDNAAPTCETPVSELPHEGAFADPLALPLPADCEVAGLRDLPGRWFVADPSQLFEFSYPKFAGTCANGFHGPSEMDDHDLTPDGQGRRFTRYTWSDGTRYYVRTQTRYTSGPTNYDLIDAFVACAMPDGTLATVSASENYDGMTAVSPLTGKRFGPKDEVASGLALVGKVGILGDALNLVIDGHHAYVAGSKGLDVIDVADPAAPVVVGHVDGSFNDVRVAHGGNMLIAYVAPLGPQTTWMIDVTDPGKPIVLSKSLEYSHSITLTTRAGKPEMYLATYTNEVPRYDISDPVNPVRLGTAVVPRKVAGVHDLFVDGDRIYANKSTEGFVAFDVSGGLDQPIELGHIATSYSHASWVGTIAGRKIALHGDEGMTGPSDGAAFLRILDGDPASPTFLTEIARYQSRPEVGIHYFEVIGDRAYIAYYQDGVRVVDLSDPTHPREVAHYNTWDNETAPGSSFEAALGIRVVGGLIYVADSLQGLLILREQ
jgi:hypothetical protein